MRKIKSEAKQLIRDQIVSVRFGARIRYLAEIAARKKRISLSSFVEQAVELALRNIKLSNYFDTILYDEDLFAVSEAKRFVKLWASHRDLLTFEEEKIIDFIQRRPHFWKASWSLDYGDNTETNKYDYENTNNIILDRLEKHWEQIKKLDESIPVGEFKRICEFKSRFDNHECIICGAKPDVGDL